jgi:hypothetical protein
VVLDRRVVLAHEGLGAMWDSTKAKWDCRRVKWVERAGTAGGGRGKKWDYREASDAW